MVNTTNSIYNPHCFVLQIFPTKSWSQMATKEPIWKPMSLRQAPSCGYGAHKYVYIYIYVLKLKNDI